MSVGPSPFGPEPAPEAVLIHHLMLLLLTAACGVTDSWKGKVYNAVTLPGIAMGFLSNGLVWGRSGLVEASLGFLLGFGVFLFVFLASRKGVSGGDVKLMGMVGAFEGPVFTVWAMFLGSVVGAFLAFAILVRQGTLLRTLAGMVRSAGSRAIPGAAKREMPEEAKQGVPYGFAIAMGVFWTYGMMVWQGGL